MRGGGAAAAAAGGVALAVTTVTNHWRNQPEPDLKALGLSLEARSSSM
jgi:hypothetical protein